MRGDLALQLRLALRPRGVAGTASALAGAMMHVAVYLPWYAVHADVAMLGAEGSRAVASVAGWQAQPWIWAVAAVALVAVAVGVAVAVDRPPPGSRRILLGVAVTVAALTGVSALLAPPRERFATDELSELEAIAAAVPPDVEVSFSVHPAAGVWLALAGAGLLLLAAAPAPDR